MILIDPRAGSEELVRPLKRLGATVEKKLLDFGDVSFFREGPVGRPISVGIEVKKLSDFFQSLESGRLCGHQLVGMLQSYECSYLIVIGAWRHGEKGVLEVPRWGTKNKISWVPFSMGSSTRRYMASALTHALHTIEIVGGVRCLFARDNTQASLAIFDLYNWGQKKWESHKTMKAIYSSPVSLKPSTRRKVKSYARKIAAQLDGVGPERVVEVVRVFKSGIGMAHASVENWQEVLGEAIGERAWKSMREED